MPVQAQQDIKRIEKILGKPIPFGAVIHHHTYTEPTELVLCQDQSYHALIHQRKIAYENCGNSNYRKCKYCGEYDNPDSMTPNGRSFFP